MNNIDHKYRYLDDSSKKKVLELIHRLLKEEKSGTFNNNYSEKILQVSTWSKADIKDMEAKNPFNSWNIAKW